MSWEIVSLKHKLLLYIGLLNKLWLLFLCLLCLLGSWLMNLMIRLIRFAALDNSDFSNVPFLKKSLEIRVFGFLSISTITRSTGQLRREYLRMIVNVCSSPSAHRKKSIIVHYLMRRSEKCPTLIYQDGRSCTWVWHLRWLLEAAWDMLKQVSWDCEGVFIVIVVVLVIIHLELVLKNLL